MGEPQGKVNFCMKIINYFMCHSNDPNYPKKSFGRKCINCLKPETGEEEMVGEERPAVSEGPKREVWGNRVHFFMSTLGTSVGLGSVWRFPTLAYKFGGATFLIIYAVLILLLGNILFFFEVSNGQYTSKNPLRVYDKVPLLQGVGISMIAYSFLFCTYYIHIVAYALYYLVSCFRSPLPWTYCPEESKDFSDSYTCTPFPGKMDPNLREIMCGNVSFTFNRTQLCGGDKNYTAAQKTKCCELANAEEDKDCKKYFDQSEICRQFEYPSAYFWSHTVMRVYREDDPKYGYLGDINGHLVLMLFIAWLVCYIGLYKGLKSMSIMMYIFVPLPYIILVIMLVAALTQTGSLDGLKELFIPKWSAFYDVDVWRAATEQAFYSVGVGMGPLITFGSYQRFHSPSHIDAILICVTIVFTGLLCSLVVFSVLGFLAHKTARPFGSVVSVGPGLIFIVYPESLDILPGSVFFALLFYLMLINLGVSSVTGITETVSSACYDIWPKTRKYKYIVNLVVILTSFSIGLSMTARGGLNVYGAFDGYAAGFTLIPLCTLELITMFIYGIGRYCEDLAFMIGIYPNRFYRYLWMIAPFLLTIVFIYGFVNIDPHNDWKPWTHVLSWFLFFCVMGQIPITMIVQLIIYGKKKNLKNIIKPPPDHGPADPEERAKREEYSIKRKIF